LHGFKFFKIKAFGLLVHLVHFISYFS